MQVSSAMSVGKFSCLGGARRWLGAVRKQNLYATGEETPMWMQKKTSTRVRKVAPKWNSIVDLQREKHLTELNSSKWRERFIQTHLHAGKISQENWGEGRHEMEKDEPCFKQKPLGHPNWYMGDRIWPVAMLQRNVIYVSVFLEKLTLVLVPGSALNHLAVEVRDQCLVPMQYWNPKTEVRPKTIPGLSVPLPDNVKPYWILQFVDGTTHIIKFPDNATSKQEVVYMMQEELARLDTIDRNLWMGSIANVPDKNGWIRVKRHGLDDYTLNEHCPLQYL